MTEPHKEPEENPPFEGLSGLPLVLLDPRSLPAEDVDGFLQQALAAIRTHLDMEVAFISEFAEGQRVFRYVDHGGKPPPISVGGSNPLEDSYCLRVVDGRLPELIPDAFDNPVAMELEATVALPVRAHASVPIRLQNGEIYGTFCCFSGVPNSSLNDRDIRMMRVFAELASKQIERQRITQIAQDEMRVRIQSVLDNDQLTAVYQPIVNVRTGQIVGFEGLSRFSAEPKRTPDVWFNEAAQVGLGPSLEVLAIKKMLAGLESLPSSVYVALNVSPDTITSGALEKVLAGMRLDRLVLEITEHSFISEYLSVGQALRPLRDRGLRVAVDDAGAGYASFRHILKLTPDIIKLDISLTRDIDSVPAERALAGALIRFAEQTGSVIVSEGVETENEHRTLKMLGVTKMQGYLFGRPMPLADAVALCATGISVESAS